MAPPSSPPSPSSSPPSELFASPSSSSPKHHRLKSASTSQPVPDTPAPTSRQRDPTNIESHEAALRVELAGVRNINEVIEGVIESLDRAKANMETISTTVNTSSHLLQTWTRILSQTEHNQRLILNPNWNGASQDLQDMEREEEQRKEDREREEGRRREAERRRAEEEARRMEIMASGDKGNRARGRGAGRGRSYGGVGGQNAGRGAGRGIGTAAGRGPSGIGRGAGLGRGRGRGLS